MPMVDIGHVSMLMLSFWMLVFVGVSSIDSIMLMELIMLMLVFVHDRHVDMKMGMLFVCQ